MQKLFQFQQKLVPDLLEIIEKRYEILKKIYSLQPVGRRSLAIEVGKTERQIRSEIEFFQKNGLILVTGKGMYVSQEGQELIEMYGSAVRELTDLEHLEKELAKQLPVKEVHIVRGNADEDESVKSDLGKIAAEAVMSRLKDQMIITVTGGSTVAAVADYLKPKSGVRPLFVPARGGLGTMYEYQASSICVKMAGQMDGEYRLLYVPDAIDWDLHSKVLEEPSVKEVMSKIEQSSLTIHGVGDALTMAKRRNSNAEELKKIQHQQAIGEAFGYYFDENGKTVQRVHSVGMSKERLSNIEHVVTVAGGSSKSKAISAYFKWGKSDVLVIDEALAQKMLSDKTNNL
ncbi:hypothetical protein CEY16_08910 [Halalkalibacillus sediminis]|uniref:Uncharacterized protein n=1 Tax=Halalkalibacillus sediminis TaxID=2018042 RepID=A0A2I0QUP5_9BACI|nr:sugar-binding domain-containing protein [Halalkalibacillus sediminis]PKR78029.1 hypothetical protein CEY16_08910 [Halalkalibacillus sediminis]